jgi:hypothetical protein
MRKILLFIAILPMMAYAQIGNITPTGNQYERVSENIIHYKATNGYALVIDDDMRLPLGEGPTAACNSLANMYTVIYNAGQTFTLYGHDFVIGDKTICLQHGEWCINSEQLSKDMVTLIIEWGADFGELSIDIGYEPIGQYYLGFDTYGFVQPVTVGIDISSRMSHAYQLGEHLSLEDVRILREAVAENYTSVQNGALAIMICDVILGND